jgi:hypothetical protein
MKSRGELPTNSFELAASQCSPHVAAPVKPSPKRNGSAVPRSQLQGLMLPSPGTPSTNQDEEVAQPLQKLGVTDANNPQRSFQSFKPDGHKCYPREFPESPFAEPSS